MKSLLLRARKAHYFERFFGSESADDAGRRNAGAVGAVDRVDVERDENVPALLAAKLIQQELEALSGLSFNGAASVHPVPPDVLVEPNHSLSVLKNKLEVILRTLRALIRKVHELRARRSE